MSCWMVCLLDLIAEGVPINRRQAMTRDEEDDDK